MLYYEAEAGRFVTFVSATALLASFRFQRRPKAFWLHRSLGWWFDSRDIEPTLNYRTDQEWLPRLPTLVNKMKSWSSIFHKMR